jgi:hypothetical protein
MQEAGAHGSTMRSGARRVDDRGMTVGTQIQCISCGATRVTTIEYGRVDSGECPACLSVGWTSLEREPVTARVEPVVDRLALYEPIGFGLVWPSFVPR